MCNKDVMMLCLAFSAIAAGADIDSSIRPVEPRCEYLVDPVGIDETHPRLSWKVAAEGSGTRDLRQSAYRVIVASSLDRLTKDESDLWDSGKVNSDDSTCAVYDGKSLTSGMGCWWKVQAWDQSGKASRWSLPAHWTMGLLNPEDWKATWIGYDAPADAAHKNAEAEGGLVLAPPRYLRHDFLLHGPIKRAMAYCSALGNFELHVNGQKVSDDQLMPGWTDYDKRVYYRAYDVTKLVRKGINAAGAILGDGWYCGYVGYGGQRDHYGKHTRFMGQIVVEYRDGSSEVIPTSSEWRAATGPILWSDFLMGETYDARQELIHWDLPGYDDRSWAPVDETAAIQAKLEAFPSHPVLPYSKLAASKVTEPEKGVFILDLGQNMAGFARLRIEGARGQKIVLRFGERLNPDGTLYTTNLRSARATDTYICKGRGVEVWEPRFTFHGFQFIEVRGLTAPPPRLSVVGIPITTASPDVGTFSCSEPMVNKLWSNAWWTQKMNFIDICTDCPQRDERLGWTGDAQAYIRTACLNTDEQPFFTKWLVALDDAQRADGQFPMVAPLKVAGDDGGPAWADAGVICPMAIYQVYGDKRLLARHYPAMARFIEFCRARCTAELLPPEHFHCFGDWLAMDNATPSQVIFMAYFAHSTDLVAQAAQALGKTEDAAKYRELFESIKASFNRAYVDEDGRIKGNTQCDYVLALAFNLLDGARRDQAVKHLIDDIEKRGWRLSTGFVGTKDLMLVLAKIGRNDVAYRLLQSTSYPSWLFEIVNGATSIWERWDGWTPERGFQDPGMNSFAHYAFGAVVQWIYEEVGGIHPLKPGYAEVLIRPQPGGKLTWAKTSYDSIRGKIVSEWHIKDGKLFFKATVPPNVRARIVVPSKDPADVVSDVKPTAVGGGEAIFEVGSGTYDFEAAQ
jgi:alpha-L-rhamnosidase